MFLILILALSLLSFWAQSAFTAAFRRWSRVPASSGLSGAEAAAAVLRHGGVFDVRIEAVPGRLSDHYDPRVKVLRLSPEVYSGRSVAAMGVAAHEAGHAIQHARNYAPLELRNLAVPTASLGSSLGFPLIFLGLIFRMPYLAVAGVVFFAAVVLFQLITLPVELDASRRAAVVLEETGIVRSGEEAAGVRKVLGAAAMTYVAAAISGLAMLLYYGALVFGGRR